MKNTKRKSNSKQKVNSGPKPGSRILSVASQQHINQLEFLSDLEPAKKKRKTNTPVKRTNVIAAIKTNDSPRNTSNELQRLQKVPVTTYTDAYETSVEIPANAIPNENITELLSNEMIYSQLSPVIYEYLKGENDEIVNKCFSKNQELGNLNIQRQADENKKNNLKENFEKQEHFDIERDLENLITKMLKQNRNKDIIVENVNKNDVFFQNKIDLDNSINETLNQLDDYVYTLEKTDLENFNNHNDKTQMVESILEKWNTECQAVLDDLLNSIRKENLDFNIEALNVNLENLNLQTEPNSQNLSCKTSNQYMTGNIRSPDLKHKESEEPRRKIRKLDLEDISTGSEAKRASMIRNNYLSDAIEQDLDPNSMSSDFNNNVFDWLNEIEHINGLMSSVYGFRFTPNQILNMYTESCSYFNNQNFLELETSVFEDVLHMMEEE